MGTDRAGLKAVLSFEWWATFTLRICVGPGKVGRGQQNYFKILKII